MSALFGILAFITGFISVIIIIGFLTNPDTSIQGKIIAVFSGIIGLILCVMFAYTTFRLEAKEDAAREQKWQEFKFSHNCEEIGPAENNNTAWKCSDGRVHFHTTE